MLSCVEYEKNYITSEPGLIPTREQILCMYVASANDSAIFYHNYSKSRFIYLVSDTMDIALCL